MEETRYKEIYSEWFHLPELLKNMNTFIMAEKSVVALGQKWKWADYKESGENFLGNRNILYFLWCGGYMGMNICQNSFVQLK